MAEKLMARNALVVAFAAVAIGGSAGPASATPDRAACAGKTRATVGAPAGRRPVAMVPGLTYEHPTMVPHGIVAVGATLDPPACAATSVLARDKKRPVAIVPGLRYDRGTMTPRGIF